MHSLIAVLRNPVDRAESAMVHFIRQGGCPADANLLDLVRRTPPRATIRGVSCPEVGMRPA